MTPEFVGSFPTVAVKSMVPWVSTVGDAGDTEIVIVPVRNTVTSAAADLVVSATDVAIKVTLAGAGREAGAV